MELPDLFEYVYGNEIVSLNREFRKYYYAFIYTKALKGVVFASINLLGLGLS